MCFSLGLVCLVWRNLPCSTVFDVLASIRHSHCSQGKAWPHGGTVTPGLQSVLFLHTFSPKSEGLCWNFNVSDLDSASKWCVYVCVRKVCSCVGACGCDVCQSCLLSAEEKELRLMEWIRARDTMWTKACLVFFIFFLHCSFFLDGKQWGLKKK